MKNMLGTKNKSRDVKYVAESKNKSGNENMSRNVIYIAGRTSNKPLKQNYVTEDKTKSRKAKIYGGKET